MERLNGECDFCGDYIDNDPDARGWCWQGRYVDVEKTMQFLCEGCEKGWLEGSLD